MGRGIKGSNRRKPQWTISAVKIWIWIRPLRRSYTSQGHEAASLRPLETGSFIWGGTSWTRSIITGSCTTVTFWRKGPVNRSQVIANRTLLHQESSKSILSLMEITLGRSCNHSLLDVLLWIMVSLDPKQTTTKTFHLNGVSTSVKCKFRTN